MIYFWYLGAAGLAILVELICMDKARDRAYKRGLEDGARRAEHQDFMRGVLWYVDADNAVEQARRDVWRREYERRKTA